MSLQDSADYKPSSRVLKPPGGGHSNIFSSPDSKPHQARPKYDQQNSSNMNGVMGTVDPNLGNDKSVGSVEAPHFFEQQRATKQAAQESDVLNMGGSKSGADPSQGTRGRVPPGGFSSGLW